MTYAKDEVKKSSAAGNAVMYLHDLVYMLAVILVLFLLIFRIIVVSGSSMKATLVDGDYLLLLSNIFYSEPEQGDIVVVSTKNYENGKPLVKRVIATEGQTVDIDFELGVVYVDGEALEEPYVYTPTNVAEGAVFPQTVEPGHVFVMGDNRNNSKDSRSSAIGQIDTREILGRVFFLGIPGTDYGNSSRSIRRIGLVS